MMPPPLPLPFVDDRSFRLLFDRSDDDADGGGRFGKVLFSCEPCPSDEPLVIRAAMAGLRERSFSEIVRASSGDC